MEIIKRTNILVKTARRLVIRSQQTNESVHCHQCLEQMISAHASAGFFGVSSRVIYRLIEQENIHFAETETNEIYVCLASTKQALQIQDSEK